jgi:putative tricarboxylic transport membrane protein
MFLFGFFGYLMRKLDLNTAAVVLALILGPIGERGLRRSLTLSGNDISILFSTPICWILIAMCILSSFSPLLMKVLKKREKAGEAK